MAANALAGTAIDGMMRTIGSELSIPRTFVHFGGCAMVLQGFKPATKDVDVCVIPHTDYHILIQDLRRGGFDYYVNPAMDALEPQDTRSSLEAMERWFTSAGPDWRIDLFPAHAVWHRGLRFSPRMVARSLPRLVTGKATVRVADASTIFLLKSVTGRWRKEAERDLDDMERLLATGLIDWDFIEREWALQRQAGLGASAVAAAREAVAILTQRGALTSWKP